LVLTVVCPYACTLAGDAYLLIRDPKSDRIFGLNGTGCAPGRAELVRFADGIPRSGPLAATVPGLVGALCEALDRFGSMSFAALLAPAIRLAEDGFTVHPYFARNIEDRKTLLASDPAAAALFLPDGKPLAAGALFVQPALAATLRRLAEEGPQSFYQGALAQEMASASLAQGGLLAAADFASHRSLWQDPISAPFFGHDVWTMPPNSYGPTLLFQLLQLESAAIADVDPDGAEFVRLGYAARRSAYKTAARFIGDPALCEAPLRKLLADALAGATPAGKAPAEARDRCTTNVVAIDSHGMSVSLIESISTPFGAAVMLGDTGIVLNNRLGGFNTDPASLNVIAPGKRPAHTLAPCMVTRDGRLVMSLGTPGTVGQTCVLAQILTRLLAVGQVPAAAIAAPRWSVDFQGKLIVEDTMAQTLQQAVQSNEPETRAEKAGWISFGSLKLAMMEEGGFRGFADDRRSATAAAF
jgi:gamma-glutamyltranspeptidase/glutathione hydrolase